MIRSTMLAGYSELARSLGGEPEMLLRASGIDPHLEASPDSYLSFSLLCDLLERTADATGCDAFGLRLSEAQGIVSLGPLGFALQHCATFRDVIDEWRQFQSVHLQGAHSELRELASELQWILYVDEPGRLGARQKVAQSVGLACNVFRALLGRDWDPIRVHFMQPAPRLSRDFRRVFRAPVLFGQEADCIAMSPDTLNRPIESAHPELRRLMERHLQEIKAGFSTAIEDQVRKAIRSGLSQQACSIGGIAAILSVAPRTLQRQLQQRGASFSGLLEEVRASAARRHLVDSQLSLTQIAAVLGYSELSAFSRAFHRSHGLSPQQWQRSHGA